MKPTSSALQGRFLTIGPPGKSPKQFLKCRNTHTIGQKHQKNSHLQIQLQCALSLNIDHYFLCVLSNTHLPHHEQRLWSLPILVHPPWLPLVHFERKLWCKYLGVPGLWRRRPPHLRIGGQNANHLGNACGPRGLPRWLRGKESACHVGDPEAAGSIPGSGRSPEGNGNPRQDSCWETPRAEEPGGLSSTGSQKSGHGWATEHGSTWPRGGEGETGPRTRGNFGSSGRASLTPPRPSRDFALHSPPPPLPQAQLQAAEGRPQEEPLPGIRRTEPAFSEAPAPRPHRLRAPGVPRAAAPAQSHGDRCHRSRVSAHRALFTVPALGFPSNRPTRSFSDWAGVGSTEGCREHLQGSGSRLGAQEAPPRKLRPLVPGSSRAAVFRLPTRPGLTAGLRRVCEGSAPAPGPEGRRGLLGRGREADAGAAQRSRAGGIRGANTCGHKGGLDGASPGGAGRPESLLRQGQARRAFSAFQAPSACGRVRSRRRRPADALEGVTSGRWVILPRDLEEKTTQGRRKRGNGRFSGKCPVLGQRLRLLFLLKCPALTVYTPFILYFWCCLLRWFSTAQFFPFYSDDGQDQSFRMFLPHVPEPLLRCLSASRLPGELEASSPRINNFPCG